MSVKIGIVGLGIGARHVRSLAKIADAKVIAFADEHGLYEVIHGVGFVYCGHKSWQAIQFGFQWKSLTPYAHSREPLLVNGTAGVLHSPV